jgi:hypothetical protein
MIDINVKHAYLLNGFSNQDGDRHPYWSDYCALDLTKEESIPKVVQFDFKYFLYEATENDRYQAKEAFRYCYTVGNGHALIGDAYLPGIEEQHSLELFKSECKLFCLRLWHELFKEDLIPADITQYRHRKDENIFYAYMVVQPPPQDWSQAIYTDFPEFKPWWPHVTTVNG